MSGNKPFVSFMMKQVEDREASLKAGRRMMKSVPHIIIVPVASNGNSKLEYPYEEWKERNRSAFADDIFDSDNRDVPMSASRFPRAWYQEIDAAFARWLRGETLSIEGTDLRQWSPANEAQVTNLRGNNIFTVEALAQLCDDHALTCAGMGGIRLRDAARAYIDTQAQGTGKLVARTISLEAELDAAQARARELEAIIKLYRERFGELNAETGVI